MGLAAGLAVSLATAANATPTLVGTTTDPTGINNLVVDGTTYDVTFSLFTLNTFTQASTLSTDATNALDSALNALSVTELGEAAGDTFYFLDVDNSLSSWEGPRCGPACANWILASNGGTFVLGQSSSFGGSYIEAADFKAVGTSSVPEPLTLSLFGAGVAGAAAAMRRRRKANKAA